MRGAWTFSSIRIITSKRTKLLMIRGPKSDAHYYRDYIKTMKYT